MQLYLIRHAQSANNEIYARTGSSDGRFADPSLTDLGHRQAQLLARHLAASPRTVSDSQTELVGDFAARHNRGGFALTHLYCSLMIRAVQTGSYIAETTDLPLVGLPEAHERGGLHTIDEITGENIGVPGPNRAWFATEYPHLILPDSLSEAGWWDRPPETVGEAIPRARIVWSQLLERHGGSEDHVAIVSHAGFFQSLITVLLSNGDKLTAFPLGEADIGFGMSNTSISRFEIGNDLVIVRYLNRIDFLPDDLITG